MKGENASRAKLEETEDEYDEDIELDAEENLEFDIANPLKPCRVVNYTAKSLFDQLCDGDIDIDPVYQRNVVWTKDKQSGLIESLMRNFYVPPLIFVVDETGSERRTCVDGKQRLTSIKRFINGEIPYKDNTNGAQWWYKEARTGRRTTKRRILPERFCKIFARKQITCVEYSGITEADERDIFQRVQMGMALSKSEQLRGILSPRVAFVHEMMEQFITPESLAASTLRWNRKRGIDFRVISFAVYFCDGRLDTDSLLKAAKGVNLTTLEPWLSQADEISNDLRNRVIRLFTIIGWLTRNGHERAFKYKQHRMISPIELIGVLVLVGSRLLVRPVRHVTHSMLSEISDLISRMRAHLHHAHSQGLFVKPAVFKTLLEFIVNTSNEADGVASNLTTPATTSVGTRKRKLASTGGANEAGPSRTRQPPKKARVNNVA